MIRSISAKSGNLLLRGFGHPKSDWPRRRWSTLHGSKSPYRYDDPVTHAAACHFPVADDEQITGRRTRGPAAPAS